MRLNAANGNSVGCVVIEAECHGVVRMDTGNRIRATENRKGFVGTFVVNAEINVVANGIIAVNTFVIFAYKTFVNFGLAYLL